jgi:hypothetical protein
MSPLPTLTITPALTRSITPTPRPPLPPTGVWDVMDPSEVVNRVMDALSDGRGPAAAARQLVEDAVALAAGAPAGDVDNTSAVVISLPLAG